MYRQLRCTGSSLWACRLFLSFCVCFLFIKLIFTFVLFVFRIFCLYCSNLPFFFFAFLYHDFFLHVCYPWRLFYEQNYFYYCFVLFWGFINVLSVLYLLFLCIFICSLLPCYGRCLFVLCCSPMQLRVHRKLLSVMLLLLF